MMDYEQPAIQNATGVCFYCTGKLADVTPTETWEVYPDQCFVKVQCSNQDCAGIAWRPAQAAQRTDLLLLVVVQDIAHADRRNTRSASASTSRPSQLIAGFEVSINCRIWVSTEVSDRSRHSNLLRR